MPRQYPLMPLLLATSLLLGCAGGTGVAPNPATPSHAADITSTLTASSSISFGNISVGASKSSTLLLSNQTTGGSSITISEIDITGTGFALSSAPTLPQTIAVGQSLDLSVTFAPLSTGTASGNIVIGSNAANASLAVALSGNGDLVQGQLNVSPSSLSFGDVAVGSNASQSGELFAGSTSITVNSASWSGQGYAISGITFPVTIAPGSSVPFTVTFAPEAAGDVTGSVSFLSDATNSPGLESFSGVGTQNSTAHTVTLTWDASSSDVIGYNVYRGVKSGGPYTKLTSSPQPSTTYADGTVQDGNTYYYVSTSVNQEGEESGYSNQATATVPSS
jgi:hypothetical protein